MGSWKENTGAGDMYAATAYVPYPIIYAAHSLLFLTF